METNFYTLDWVVLGLYFLLLFGVAIWVILQRQKDSADYFLAGRNVGWFVIGTSIFASNIGSEHLVGLAGAGADTGVVLGHYEIHAYLILLLGWVFVPYYIRSGVFTMPEFLERRFNSAARWYLSIISLVGYVLTKVSVTVYAGGVVFETLLGIDFWSGALVTVILTGIYSTPVLPCLLKISTKSCAPKVQSAGWLTLAASPPGLLLFWAFSGFP